MKKEIVSGIYMIKNIINNKVYIGRAVNIERRWKQHIKDLENNKHHSKILQNEWDYYEKRNFQFIILEKTNKNNLIEKEQQYLNLYKSFNGNGYNISNSAVGPKGVKRSDLINYNIKNKSKPVFQYDLQGKFIKKWDSVSEAAKILNVKKYGISKCCRLLLKHSYGYVWKYYFAELISQVIPFKSMPIFQYDMNENLIREWNSQTEASKKLKINKSHISSVCNMKRKSAGGYIWKIK